MRRREFIALVASIGWPLAAGAQQMRRVGILIYAKANDPEASSVLKLFQDSLKDLGWVDGSNIEIIIQWANERQEIAAKAKDIVAHSPDVLFATPTIALLPLLEETTSIPIVFANVSDPLSQGIITNLAHPGGHVTGFSNPPFSLVGKSLQLLKDIAPNVSRVALIISATNGSAPAYFHTFDGLARSLALGSASFSVHNRSEIETFITSFAKQPDGGALFFPRDLDLELN